MKVTPWQCAPAVNESERKAFEYLKSRLQSTQGNDEWILMSNLAFSVTHQLQSDEIDIVAIGPPGVRVIEIKHWTAQWVDSHTRLVEQEADKVTNKARKIGTTLRKKISDLPRVDGVILLTYEPSRVKRLNDKLVRGVRFHTLKQWKDALNFESRKNLSPLDVKRSAQELEPRSAVAIDGSLRWLAGYINLEILTPKEDRFHRIYKSKHDKVILHLYDMSASDDKKPEIKAKREFEALHNLQLYPWAPRILDSYQAAPGYAGEMFFFTIVDPSAPCIADRISDEQWNTENRLLFARNTVRALSQFHKNGTENNPFVHRNLNQQTILVKHDNSPILTGFDRAKIPSNDTVASSEILQDAEDSTIAPEILTQGISAADQRSDVYSLCASLCILFQNRQDETSANALEILKKGLTDEPQERCDLEDLDMSFSQLLGESKQPLKAPPARFWTEDQTVEFKDRKYRIVERLGSGGIGTAFKVIEIDRSTEEDLGTYVGKVVYNENDGKKVLKSYRLARSHLGRRQELSAIYEVANEWQENEFVALMTWIDGTPLGDFAGVFPLLLEDQQEISDEALAIRWLSDMCKALDVLHRNGLVHGDVSPRNMIISGFDLVLTDYDCVEKIGAPIVNPGTIMYYPSSHTTGNPTSPSDDFYALAASFFHVIYEKEPFQYSGELAKERGVNWDGIDRTNYPTLVAFIDKATHPEPAQRLLSAEDALAILKVTDTDEKPKKTTVDSAKKLAERKIDWLQHLLQSYPGSRWGNCETRGLDTRFAKQTYVETQLEETLERDIRERRVRLVILCGNAGDGKTALLQHLAARLGLGEHRSSKRILEGQMDDGLIVRINLDGSAAWHDRSADEILDDFLKSFQEGPPSEDIVHLLAINDGRLLEWIEQTESQHGGDTTDLTYQLEELLQGRSAVPGSHIRFINLNQRSLVGGITADRKSIQSDFLERLLDQLYGGNDAVTIWEPCQSCSARERCEVYRATCVFGPQELPGFVGMENSQRARQRLFESLQAVHLRGETHITIRELRAALVYILFGVHFCEDYHEDSAENVWPPYWDRAFAADSPGRQGEVLQELVRLDPALEAHPQIDRYLLSRRSTESTLTAPQYNHLSLDSARRRAYFEWTEEHIEQVTGNREALSLARGRDLRLFRDLAIAQDSDKQRKLCERLCAGISRIEDLPPQALDQNGVVPLRVTPRTPTETAFWVEKSHDAFRVEADLPPETEGIDRLHRHAFLIYSYNSGREERLQLGADLFHLLLELSDGYQLGDISTDDAFTNLSVFVQRLIREDERELLAWNPIQDEAIYKIFSKIEVMPDGSLQKIILEPLIPGDSP